MTNSHLTKINPDVNQRRYYRLRIEPGLFGDWGLVREWGRMGSAGRRRTDWFDEAQDAPVAADKLAKKKVRRGYE